MTVEVRGFVLRRNWGLPVGLLVAAAAGVWMTPESVTSTFGVVRGVLGFVVAACALVAAPMIVLRNAYPRALPRGIRADERSVVVEGEARIRSADILEAKLVPRGETAIVELGVRGRGTLRLWAGAADARALLETIGARRTEFRLVASLWKRFALSAASLFVLALFSGGPVSRSPALALPVAALYGFPLALLVGLIRGRLTVGTDGFTTRWLGRRRFVPFGDVASVEEAERLVGPTSLVKDTLVVLRSKRRVRLRAREIPVDARDLGRESEALGAHLRQAHAAWARAGSGAEVAHLVARGSRSAGEWLADLAALARGAGATYRTAPVTADALATVTSDARADAGARVGAAVALAKMGGPIERQRVRVAAEACADAKLRGALLEVVDAEDDLAIEAALATFRA